MKSLKSFLFDAINLSILGLILFWWIRPLPEDLNNIFLPTGLVATASGITAAILHRWTKYRTLGRLLFDNSPTPNPYRPWYRTFWKSQLVWSLILVLLAAGKITQFSLRELTDEHGFAAAQGLFQSLLSPDWQILPEAIIKVIETFFIALLATILAAPIAFLLSFFSAKNLNTSKTGFASYLTLRSLLNIVRSIEPVIWAIIFAVWVGVGPFAGMLALMIQSIASLTKQFSEIIEEVQQGPIDGVTATGARPIQVIWYGIVPQVILPFVSFTIYRWDINVRMATIIGFAGGGGIGNMLYQYSMRAQWPQVGCLIAIITIVVWLLDLASAYIREALK